MNVLAKNRKAKHDYNIEKTYEAGIVLQGGEVKSVKNGNISLKESYIKITKDRQAYLVGAHIAPYQKAEELNPKRDRKLLLKKKEILKLSQALRESNLTIIPLSIYLKKGFIKLKIALAKRTSQKDRRTQLKEKAEKEDIKRELSE